MQFILWTATACVAVFVLYALGFIGYREFIIEKPRYSIFEKADGYEVREYNSYITASYTRESGDIDNGFMQVAGYIFGDNTTKKKVAMTSPVIDTPAEANGRGSEKIAMTSPVIDDQRTTSFVLPRQYSIEDLPTPNNRKVSINEVPAKRWAVKRFLARDFRDQEFLETKRKELAQALIRDEKEFTGNYQYAFYDAPGLVWFLRKNEVWIELD